MADKKITVIQAPPLMLDREQAAAALSIGDSTLEDLVRKGELPPPRRISAGRRTTVLPGHGGVHVGVAICGQVDLGDDLGRVAVLEAVAGREEARRDAGGLDVPGHGVTSARR